MNADTRRKRAEEPRRSPASTPSSSASVLWTPQDVSAHLLTSPLVSSVGLVDCKEVIAEARIKPPQELFAPPLAHHVLQITLKAPPFDLYRDIGGEVTEGQNTPGSMTLFPAGRPGRVRWGQTGLVMHLYLSPRFLERVAQPFVPAPEKIELLPVFSEPDPQIEHIGRALLADVEQGAPTGRLFGESLTTALAVHLLRHYTAFPARIPDRTETLGRVELRRSYDYIQDHLDRDLSLPEIGRASGVSANYLTTLFKQATGYSLHQYVIRQRVERARSLLRRSDISIGEIAHRVGFYDSAHLTRHFKRLLGVTPRQMRQSQLRTE